MCRKSLSLILPFSKNVGGAFENNLSSGGGNLKKKKQYSKVQMPRGFPEANVEA